MKKAKTLTLCTYQVSLILAGLVLSTGELRSAPVGPWQWRSPLPQGNPLHRIMAANGTYLAVGDVGTILTSRDGTNWTRQVSGTTLPLRACAYGGGTYVVVGDFGTVLTSSDARAWTSHYAGTFYSLNAVTYAAGQFVAVGEQTSILTSPDGANWSPRSSGSWELFDVLYAGGLFVAAGGISGTPANDATQVILTSPDARVWTPRRLASGPAFASLAWGNGQLAALTYDLTYAGGNELWSSGNGLDWQPRPLPPLYSSISVIACNSGKWLLAAGSSYDGYNGDGVLLASDDLLSWSTVVSNTMPVSGLAFGAQGVASRIDGSLLISSNGATWGNPWGDSPAMNQFRDLKFLNGTFIGLAYDKLYFSADGRRWTNATAATLAGPLLSLTYGNGLYVAGSEFRTIEISTDGVNWTNPAPGLSIAPYAGDVAVAYGNGVFVGASGYAGDILTSTDGTNWMVQQLQTNAYSYAYFRDITFGNGRFVAVSDNATATSADGTNWCLNTGYYGLQSVAGGNGRFVAVGYNVVGSSADGTNWVLQNSSAFGNLTDVAFGEGVFVAVGAAENQNALVPEERPLWLSTDGLNWSPASSGTARDLWAVAFGDSSFVVEGVDGAVLQSEPLFHLTLSAHVPPVLQLSGPANRAYRIEYRNDLGPAGCWAELLTGPTNAPSQFMDATWTNSPQRFYRALLLPEP